MKKIRIKGEYDENYCLIDGDRAEIWGTQYKSFLVRVTTRAEAMSLAADLATAQAEKQAAKEAAATELVSREERLAKLAGEYDDLILTKRGEVEDKYGNYLFSLPRELPADVGQWIKAEASAYFGGGE